MVQIAYFVRGVAVYIHIYIFLIMKSCVNFFFLKRYNFGSSVLVPSTLPVGEELTIISYMCERMIL